MDSEKKTSLIRNFFLRRSFIIIQDFKDVRSCERKYMLGFRENRVQEEFQQENSRILTQQEA